MDAGLRRSTRSNVVRRCRHAGQPARVDVRPRAWGPALTFPAFQAIQPDLVPATELRQAIALGSMTFNVGRAVGPAIGGLVVAVAGPGWVFMLNAVSFLAIVGVLVWWRRPELVETMPAETFSGAMRAGPALRRTLASVSRGAQSCRSVHASCRGVAGAAACRRPRSAATEQRRVRRAARVLRHRRSGRCGGAPAPRRTLSSRSTDARAPRSCWPVPLSSSAPAASHGRSVW